MKTTQPCGHLFTVLIVVSEISLRLGDDGEILTFEWKAKKLVGKAPEVPANTS
jgi:hypothetical protein